MWATSPGSPAGSGPKCSAASPGGRDKVLGHISLEMALGTDRGNGLGEVCAPPAVTRYPHGTGGQRGSEREAQGHNAGAPGGSRRGLGELGLGVQGQHPSG